MIWTVIRVMLELIASFIILCVEALVIGVIIIGVGLWLIGRAS